MSNPFGSKPDLRALFAATDRVNRETDELLHKHAQDRRLRQRKAAENLVRREHVSHKTKGLEFILSDATPDRYDDIILTSGWKLDSLRRNPIALFAHQGSFPIGKWKDVRVEDNALRGTLQLAPLGSSDRIDELHALIAKEVLKEVSVGLTTISYEERKGDKYGLVYTEQELVECSLVSAPANPNALNIAKRLNISSSTQELIFAAERAERPVAIRPALDGKYYTAKQVNELIEDLLDAVKEVSAHEREAMRVEIRREITDLKKDLTISELQKEIVKLKGGGGIIR